MQKLIQEAIETQIQIAVLQEKLSKFTTPILFDLTLLPEILQTVSDSDIDPKEIRHCFVFIAVYMYSPSAILGQYSIKAGLCQQIGDVINCCRQVVSEMFSEALLRYNKLPVFKIQVNKAFDKINIEK